MSGYEYTRRQLTHLSQMLDTLLWDNDYTVVQREGVLLAVEGQLRELKGSLCRPEGTQESYTLICRADYALGTRGKLIGPTKGNVNGLIKLTRHFLDLAARALPSTPARPATISPPKPDSQDDGDEFSADQIPF